MRISDWSSDVCSSDLLTLYVVRKALEQCRRWRDAGHDLTISVTLSARNLFDQHLVADIGIAIEAAGVPPRALPLEQIGRASGRERVWKYVSNTEVDT